MTASTSRAPLRPAALRLVAAILVCSLPAAGRAHAATAHVSHVSALADTSRPVTFLHEIVVTGSRFPRAYYQSPQALSFIGSAQLREQQPAVLADVLSRLPGVDMSKDSPWEQRPVLRGLSGQRVLVLMDGIPMNSARGNGPHPSLLDPSQVERVEVVRGPSSVAYGSDALGGAINIITRGVRPADGTTGSSLQGSLSMSGALGDNQYGGALELQPRFGKLGMLLEGGARHANEFRAPDGKVPHSGFEDWQGLARARYPVGERATLEAGWQGYRGSDVGIPGLSSPIAQYPPGWLDVFQFKYYDRDLAHVSLDHRYEHSWIASSRVRAYWQGERRNFFDAQDIDASLYPYLGLPPDGSLSTHTENDRFFDLKTTGFQVQGTSVQTKTYRFTFGLDAARDVTAGNNVSRAHEVFPSGPTPDVISTSQSVPRGHFDDYGGYFENEWYVHPKWTLNTGGRWTQYAYQTEAGESIPAGYFGPGTPATNFEAKSVNDGAASGSVGVVYAPLPDLHLSANVANGYRHPNAQDLFFNGFASVGLVLGNPDLKPETSVSYDLGLRYENAHEALSGNLFYSTYTDLIDAVLYASNPYYQTFRYENVTKARIWGGEAEGEWSIVRGLKARATAAGAIGDILGSDALRNLYGSDMGLDKAPLGGVPPFKGSFGLRWDDSDQRFWLEPSMRYSWRTNRLPLPTGNVEQLVDFKKEWLVVDVMTGVRLEGGQQASIGIRNVGDRRYREALASLPSPGRALVVSFSSHF